MKVSVITVTYNSAGTIADCVRSVENQTYQDFEHIIIDGASTDSTLSFVESIPSDRRLVLSEPDNGIYDAMNKGLSLATGDIIGFLNSDDFYCGNDIMERIINAFTGNNTDVVLGDVQFIDPVNNKRVIRYYSAAKFSPGRFRYGFMPPHPGFYARRSCYESLGGYKTDYAIAADYELLIRFLAINKLRYTYLNAPFVSMRPGGVSNRSIASNITLNREIIRACRENGLRTNIFNVYSKYLYKFFEFIGNRKR